MSRKSIYVLDASALLAMLQREAGAERVASAVEGGAISSVNWSEVLQKALARNLRVRGLREDVEALGLSIIPFSADHAEDAARLWVETKTSGLCLGDRACLALAKQKGVPALTTDQDWTRLRVGVKVEAVR